MSAGMGGIAGVGAGMGGVGSVGGAGGEGMSVGGVGSQGQSSALGNVSAPQSGNQGVKVSFSQAAKSFGEPSMPGVQMAEWNQMMLQNMEKMSDLVALALLALMNKDRQ
jgi:hypothetical protein